MKLFHSDENSLNIVFVKISFPFYSSDFTIGTKSIVPTLVSVDSTAVNIIPKFICSGCQKEVGIENLVSKCYRCGELFSVSKLFYHKVDGIMLCEKHMRTHISKSNSETEEKFPKSLDYYLSSLTSK